MGTPSQPNSKSAATPKAIRRLGVESLEQRMNMSVATGAISTALPYFANALKNGTTRTYGVRPIVSITTTEQQTPSKEISTTTTTTTNVSVPTNNLSLSERRRPNSKFFKPKPAPLTLLPQPSTPQSGPLQNPNLPAPVKQFVLADLKPNIGVVGGNPGFQVDSVKVHQNGLTIDSAVTLSADLITVTQQDANTVVTTWKTANGEATISAILITQGDDKLMQVAVTAGANWTIDEITFAAPRIFTPSSNDLMIYNPFKGGSTQPWLQDGYHVQSTAAWPNMAYSPMAVFYNARTSEGVGFVSFDGGLEQREVYWVTGAGEAHPYVRWHPNIHPGSTETTTLQEHHAFNMPTEAFLYYRNTFLVPFMQSQGISEGTLNIGKVMAWSDWPTNSDVSISAAKALQLGASSYLQYAPGDGLGYYEPNPQTFAWYNTLKSASNIQGLKQLGVLIDPFMKSRRTSPNSDPTSPLWFPDGGGPQSLADPDVQTFLNRLKTDLVNQGVNFAFWDMGTAAPTGEGKLWFDLLKTWKQAGISIAAESSCDIASYVTGTNLINQFQNNNDYWLMQAVTPNAKIVVYDDRATATNGVYWWQAASAKGFIPLLYRTQMETWAQQNAI